MPLYIDEATSDLRRPSEDRVCVEVNLDYDLPDRIWIERENHGRYWQEVIYEKKPKFYYRCRHFGHTKDQCKFGAGPVAPPPIPVGDPIPRLVILTKDNGKGKVVEAKPHQRRTPVRRDQRK